MKDSSGAQVLGRTSWKRLGIVMVPTVVAAGVLTVMISQGAVAASFAVSGQQFKLTAGTLTGTGFANYGTVDKEVDGTEVPVAVSAFSSAQITDLCQSVVTPLPVIGDVTLTIKAGASGTPVSATNLVIDMTQLNAGTATFTNINIGQDASTLTGTASGAVGTPGLFGQQASEAVLDNVQQVAVATNAGSFTLSNMSMGVSTGDKPCF
ncbi:MAG TPA: DUF6230 family protein [Actinocrinis sp.]